MMSSRTDGIKNEPDMSAHWLLFSSTLLKQRSYVRYVSVNQAYFKSRPMCCLYTCISTSKDTG